MRWPGGPLELELRRQEKSLPADPDLRETIRHWYDPATLSLLQGTPVNCLLLTWSESADSEVEKEQQQLVRVYAREARSRRIAVLGLIRANDIHPTTGPSIRAAGLDGLIVEGASRAGDAILPDARDARRRDDGSVFAVPMASWAKLSPSLDILAAADAVVPGLRKLSEEVSATPSSEPWIDSNLWLVRCLRSSSQERPVWLGERLSEDAAPADYMRAIADAAAAGGRWVISLSDSLRRDLRRSQPEALATWHQIVSYLRFYQDHADWCTYPPFAVCGFVQDSSAKRRELSGENLNLACRMRIPLRVIERSQLAASSLDGLQLVHGIDMIQPTQRERKVLSSFAENGGFVVVGPSWKEVEIPKDQDFSTARHGKGRFVVYREPWPEASSLTKDLVDLLGRDNFGVRLFRSSSVLSHVSVDKAGARLVVQLINYASFPAESILIRVMDGFRSAHFYTPEGATEQLALEKSIGHLEVSIPKFHVCGAVVLER